MNVFTVYGVKGKDQDDKPVDLVVIVMADTAAEAETKAKSNPSLDCNDIHVDAGHKTDLSIPPHMVCIRRLDHCGWGAHK